MGIEVRFIGAMHCKGEGKKGPYDFCQVKYVKPLESVQRENRKVKAFGGEEATVDLDPSALDQFQGLEPGTKVNLKIGPNPANLQRNLCTGLEK